MNGPIAYMARNHVAANILMLFLVVGGIIVASDAKQEVFPEFALDMVSIQVAYPGATPSEVEDAIIRPIELAVSGLDNIKKIRSTATENIGVVTLEVMEGADANMVLQDAKAEVDRILTFPEEAEKPITSKITNRNQVMTLVVFGDASERALFEQAERIKDDLLAFDNITQVELAGYRPYEISIEISEANLRKYNLTLPQVAGIVRSSSLDLAGGTIKAQGGEVLIRTTEKRFTGADFDSVTVFNFPNGQKVMLRDIANVVDGFAEAQQSSLYDGKSAIRIDIYRVGEQKPKDISQTAREFIDQRNKQLPESIQIDVWEDWSVILDQRLNLLLKNGMIGLILVLITLSLFLEVRLALWVSAGIAISFLGSMVLMPITNISINMISLFAYLIILGVVVDDAIVVGENIYYHQKRKGLSLYKASVVGTREVTLAVVFAGLTTMAAFGPLLFAGSFLSKFMGVVPIIVISVLILSLVEAFFILPSHLNGRLVASTAPIWAKIESKRSNVDRFVKWMIDVLYATTLKWAAANRYTVLAIAIAILLITFGMVGGGFIKFTFMPDIDSDAVTVSLTMPKGTPYEETKRWAEEIQKVGEELIAEIDKDRTDGGSNMKHSYVLVGQQVQFAGAMGTFATSSANIAQIFLLMDDADKRTIRSTKLADMWREKVGAIPGAEDLSFVSDLMGAGADLEIQLSHTNFDQLLAAVDRVKTTIASYDGTSEISDSYSEGKREMKIRLRPEAQSLGINERELAQQVRGAFFGSEALRIQRGQNEVKVMVRYPEEDRRTLATIESMRIRTMSGMEIPFKEAAYIEEGRGYSVINRTDRRRVVNITAKVDNNVANATEILNDVRSGILPIVMNDYPGLAYGLEGESERQRESMQGLIKAFSIGLIIIYALLAIPFKSFLQPIVVMSAIPFGIVGAIGGHILLGYNVSIMSLFGIVALNGVVVNSSLVLIDFINTRRAKGMELLDAIYESGKRRFRPIIMTALTTFFGLTPMILETDIQAQFLIPMAISLGFGVLFATFITLVLIPSLYLILEDARRLIGAADHHTLTAEKALTE